MGKGIHGVVIACEGLVALEKNVEFCKGQMNGSVSNAGISHYKPPDLLAIAKTSRAQLTWHFLFKFIGKTGIRNINFYNYISCSKVAIGYFF